MLSNSFIINALVLLLLIAGVNAADSSSRTCLSRNNMKVVTPLSQSRAHCEMNEELSYSTCFRGQSKIPSALLISIKLPFSDSNSTSQSLKDQNGKLLPYQLVECCNNTIEKTKLMLIDVVFPENIFEGSKIVIVLETENRTTYYGFYIPKESKHRDMAKWTTVYAYILESKMNRNQSLVPKPQQKLQVLPKVARLYGLVTAPIDIKSRDLIKASFSRYGNGNGSAKPQVNCTLNWCYLDMLNRLSQDEWYNILDANHDLEGKNYILLIFQTDQSDSSKIYVSLTGVNALYQRSLVASRSDSSAHEINTAAKSPYKTMVIDCRSNTEYNVRYLAALVTVAVLTISAMSACAITLALILGVRRFCCGNQHSWVVLALLPPELLQLVRLLPRLSSVRRQLQLQLLQETEVGGIVTPGSQIVFRRRPENASEIDVVGWAVNWVVFVLPTGCGIEPWMLKLTQVEKHRYRLHRLDHDAGKIMEIANLLDSVTDQAEHQGPDGQQLIEVSPV